MYTIMLLAFIGFLVGAVTTLIIYTAYVFIFAFTLWMAVDAAKQDRFWWVLLILGVPIIGCAVYYFTEKKHEYAKVQSRHIHQSQTEAQHETSHRAFHHHRKDDHLDRRKDDKQGLLEEKVAEKTEIKKEDASAELLK